MASASRPNIGFLGLGVMGTPMAANLIKAGFPLTVWNRTTAKTEPLLKLGAKAGAHPAHVASVSDITILMVSRPQDVEAVALGPRGAVEGLKPGACLIDMSTVSPATSRKLSVAVGAAQGAFLDAPVVGSKGPATDGTLVILAGGPAETLERCRPVLSAMGKTIVHAGPTGAGSALKLATNLMLAHLAAGYAEGLLLVEKSGLDPKRYLEVLDASPFRTQWYQTKGIGMMKRDFNTHFALKHMHKDVRLMLDQGKATGTALPVTAAIQRLFEQSEGAGRAEQDYSAILAQLEGAKA